MSHIGRARKLQLMKSEEEPNVLGFRQQVMLQGFRALQNLVANQNTILPMWSRMAGSDRRQLDLDTECRYPTDDELTPDYYKNAYDRWGVATRAVDLWPDECWTAYPDVYEKTKDGETTFEKAFMELEQRTMLNHYLHRIDRLSGISECGILFYGLDDGGDPKRPPRGVKFDKQTGQLSSSKEYQLNYIRAFDQSLFTVDKTDDDIRSPRYGQPVEYAIQFESNASVGASAADLNNNTETTKVHWTRVQHIADNTQTSEIFGRPRLMPIINYICDMRKIGGSSAEMFFKGGFPGYSFTTYPDLAGDSLLDEDSLRETMLLYQNGLQRWLATIGGEWKALAQQVADPDKHMQWSVSQICLTLGCPVRIFMGSESGHLASTTDSDQWKSRCSGRQLKYINPRIYRPTVDRLIGLGCLPKPSIYHVEWKDLRSLSDADRVELSLKKVQTLMQYTTGQVNQVMPLTFLLTLIMGYTEEQAKAIITELEKNPPPVAVPLGPDGSSVPGPTGGGRTGNPNRSPVGRPAQSPPEGSPRTRGRSGANPRTS